MFYALGPSQVVKVLRDAAAGRTRWPTDHGPPPARAAEANGGSRRWEGRRRDGERMRLQLLPAEERRRVLRERLVRKFAAKEPVYDNCRMLSQARCTPPRPCSALEAYITMLTTGASVVPSERAAGAQVCMNATREPVYDICRMLSLVSCSRSVV